jgi:hypothetical protein
MYKTIFVLLIVLSIPVYAQISIGIGVPDSNAVPPSFYGRSKTQSDVQLQKIIHLYKIYEKKTLDIALKEYKKDSIEYFNCPEHRYWMSKGNLSSMDDASTIRHLEALEHGVDMIKQPTIEGFIRWYYIETNK